jgi:hypothetical protein
MRLPVDRAVLVQSRLVEGNSIRSAERITGHHRDTITRLLVLVGGKCEALLDSMLQGVEVANVQADEIWSYVAMKERTKKAQGIIDPEIGDAYTYVAIERDSKLVLTHHLGRRNRNRRRFSSPSSRRRPPVSTSSRPTAGMDIRTRSLSTSATGSISRS